MHKALSLPAEEGKKASNQDARQLWEGESRLGQKLRSWRLAESITVAGKNWYPDRWTIMDTDPADVPGWWDTCTGSYHFPPRRRRWQPSEALGQLAAGPHVSPRN